MNLDYSNIYIKGEIFMKKIILVILIATSMVSVACANTEQESKETKIVEEVKEVE